MSVSALVCHRDPEVRAQVSAALRARRFSVIEVADARGSLDVLHAGVAVAVVGWQGERSSLLLRELAKRPEVTAFLFDEELRPSDAEIAFRICPRLLTHGQSLGASLLADRVVAATGRVMGDLMLRDGVVTHVPSGRTFSYKVAARLLAAHPRQIQLPEHSEQEVIRKFRKWLREVGSTVAVLCVRRESLYGLADAVVWAA